MAGFKIILTLSKIYLILNFLPVPLPMGKAASDSASHVLQSASDVLTSHAGSPLSGLLKT